MVRLLCATVALVLAMVSGAVGARSEPEAPTGPVVGYHYDFKSAMDAQAGVTPRPLPSPTIPSIPRPGSSGGCSPGCSNDQYCALGECRTWPAAGTLGSGV